MDETEALEWVGPTGHTSPTFGELVPGRHYPVPKDHVAAFLKDADCWCRPADNPSNSQETKE